MADVSLVFDSGIKTLELSNGKGQAIEVVFNPYDMLFLGRIMDAAEKLDEIQTKLREHKTDDWKEVLAYSLESDKEMREVIDGIFEVPVCAALFPKQTVHALGGGLPAWANLLYALIDQMDARLSVEKETAQKRIRKYSEKYKK